MDGTKLSNEAGIILPGTWELPSVGKQGTIQNPIFAALPFWDPSWKSFPRSCAVLLLAKLDGIEIQLFIRPESDLWLPLSLILQLTR